MTKDANYIFLILGPSRSTETITTTTTTVTSTTTTRRQSKVVKRKVQKRRRKVKRRRRTYVVEYDVDEYNNKFGIKTAKRIIKKRRRKTKKSRKKSSVKCSRRNQNQDSQNIVEGVLSGGRSRTGLREAYPKLRLFGDKNALEYFSDNSENDEGIDSLNNSIETGDGLLIMSTARPSHRNLISRKRVAINSTMGTPNSEGGIDILSNIMDTMNRWHSMSRPSTIEKIKIKEDGSLECAPQPIRTPDTATEQPNSDILNAPMNPRNDSNTSNRSFNNSNGYRGNNSSQSTGNYSSQNRFGDRNEQTAFQPFQQAGSFNDDGNANNFQQDNFSPRNRPFQRQRSNNNNSNRMLRNQFQPRQQPQPQQGLYDGEDIPPIPNLPTQCNYFN